MPPLSHSKFPFTYGFLACLSYLITNFYQHVEGSRFFVIFHFHKPFYSLSELKNLDQSPKQTPIRFWLELHKNCVILGGMDKLTILNDPLSLTPSENYYSIYNVHEMGPSHLFISDIHFHLQNFNFLKNCLPCL